MTTSLFESVFGRNYPDGMWQTGSVYDTWFIFTQDNGCRITFRLSDVQSIKEVKNNDKSDGCAVYLINRTGIGIVDTIFLKESFDKVVKSIFKNTEK